MKGVKLLARDGESETKNESTVEKKYFGVERNALINLFHFFGGFKNNNMSENIPETKTNLFQF